MPPSTMAPTSPCRFPVCAEIPPMLNRPGAVSRQLALLEEHVGVSLFRRSHRQLTLTHSDTQYLQRVSKALLGQSEATNEIRLTKGRDPLHIWCPMTFGLRWLVPRLPAFRAAQTDRDVVFTTSRGSIDFGTRTTDVAIRIGKGNWPGCSSHKLMGIELTPVCSPALLQRLGPMTNPSDLKRATLLQSTARPGYWRLWLEASGAVGIDPGHGIRFESVSLAYQMALNGAGVALGQLALVADDLQYGRLVVPFAQCIDSAIKSAKQSIIFRCAAMSIRRCKLVIHSGHTLHEHCQVPRN